MKIEHLLEAITETAREYEGQGASGQRICEALRGVVARAGRYAAKDPDTEVALPEHELRAMIRDEIAKMVMPLALVENPPEILQPEDAER
jgi:hypothetical protein